MNQQWAERDRPPRLERRYQFPEYSALRDFLDQAAALSEREGLYPDMSFGRDYLNVTIHASEESGEVGAEQRRFAELLEAIFSPERE